MAKVSIQAPLTDHCFSFTSAASKRLLVRLATFYFMAKAENSSLKPFVQKLLVATNETTQLPDYWQQMSGAIHRKYTNAEIEAWRLSVPDLQSVGF